jgi:hypothetical protein
VASRSKDPCTPVPDCTRGVQVTYPLPLRFPRRYSHLERRDMGCRTPIRGSPCRKEEHSHPFLFVSFLQIQGGVQGVTPVAVSYEEVEAFSE